MVTMDCCNCFCKWLFKYVLPTHKILTVEFRCRSRIEVSANRLTSRLYRSTFCKSRCSASNLQHLLSQFIQRNAQIWHLILLRSHLVAKPRQSNHRDASDKVARTRRSKKYTILSCHRDIRRRSRSTVRRYKIYPCAFFRMI